jgi:gas vesicle protein
MFAVLRASLRMFVIGFIAGTLFAPRPGAETRKLLGEKLTELANQILELAALPPIDTSAAQNGGEAPRQRGAARRSSAREDA